MAYTLDVAPRLPSRISAQNCLHKQSTVYDMKAASPGCRRDAKACRLYRFRNEVALICARACSMHKSAPVE